MIVDWKNILWSKVEQSEQRKLGRLFEGMNGNQSEKLGMKGNEMNALVSPM
jgi:hypothetical protein